MPTREPDARVPAVNAEDPADASEAGQAPRHGLHGGARRMAITYRPICELRLDPANARVHGPKQVRQIARSIEAFGFNVPILVDAGLKIIAGHGRLLASRQLGWAEVPTICLDHMTPAQVRAFMIADNRLTETSVWNDQLLGEQLRELSLLDLDFSLEATGFDMAEIDLRIQALEDADTTITDAMDETPALATAAVSRAGDLWQLGRHRIYCGSALLDKSFDVLMDGKLAGIVFTDPPYNVRIDGHATGLGATHHREFMMGSGELTEAQFTEFLAVSCGLLSRHTHDGALHFVCMDWRHIGEMVRAGQQVYTELKNLCVWVKHNSGMGSLYRSQHELVFVFKQGRGAHRNNVQLGQYGRHRSNVWSYRGANGFGRCSEEITQSGLHPTVKPVQMVADAILDCSARGDIVLDGFLGTGTSMMAAERTGRCCFGIELDPRYVDAGIRRWEAFTGEQARHIESGISFRDLERQRACRPDEPGSRLSHEYTTGLQARDEVSNQAEGQQAHVD